jgi:NAD(P)-dependent dehydrogenase (short-subunit alcohol dehydrogenase family)
MLMDTAKLMFKDGLMAGQRILVTGGGTGLGKEMAEAFLKLGAEVVIWGRRGGVLEETAKELMDKHGGKVIAQATDIRNAEAIKESLDHLWASVGPVHGLVNNAAGNFISRTQDLSPRAFDAIANIVFHGTFYLTLDIGKRWIDQGIRGSVINILTTWVWNGSAFTVPSAMSKSGVRAMAESLAVEWGRYGIRFNNIAPGPFPTKGAWERLSPGKQLDGDEDRTGNPLGRVGQMHELANLAVFLMGPGAEYVNGQTIAIDGAMYQASGGNFSGLRAWDDAQWEAVRSMIKSSNEKDRAARTA